MLSFIVTRENCFMVFKDVDKWTTFGSFSTARICLTRMTLNAEDNLPFSCQIFIRSNSTSVYRLQNSTYQMLTWVTLYNNFLFVCIPIFVTEELCIHAEGKNYSLKTRARCILFSPEKTIKKVTNIHSLFCDCWEVVLWLFRFPLRSRDRKYRIPDLESRLYKAMNHL